MRRLSVFGSTQRAEPGGIDLTPMLDVVFIMLIFFVVTASFIKEAGVEVERPAAATTEAKPGVRIVVAVAADDRIWIAGRLTDPRSVRRQLERLHAENPRGALVVQADARSSARAVALVLDAARAAGIEDAALATRKK